MRKRYYGIDANNGKEVEIIANEWDNIFIDSDSDEEGNFTHVWVNNDNIVVVTETLEIEEIV